MIVDPNPEVQRYGHHAILPLRQDRAGAATPVQLTQILEEVADTITRFVILPDPLLAILIALWLANTYSYQHFQYCGYLTLRSATPRCGKSKLLRLLRLFAKGNPRVTTTPTAAALFRSTREVLLLDEVDRLRNADKESFGAVLAVLNMGFEAGGVVERTEKIKGNFEVRSYEVYGPKALAGIESVADTLADRSFRIEMQRSPTRMPRLNERKMQESAFRIREGLQRWADAHANHIDEAYERLPDTIPALADFDDRLQDIAEPLVLLASLADAERTISGNVHGEASPGSSPAARWPTCGIRTTGDVEPGTGIADVGRDFQRYARRQRGNLHCIESIARPLPES